MADIMVTHPDGAPVAVPLIPMFYLLVESLAEKLGRKKKAVAQPH